MNGNGDRFNFHIIPLGIICKSKVFVFSLKYIEKKGGCL